MTTTTWIPPKLNNTWLVETQHMTSSFPLVVDNFGVKYAGKENAQHPLDTVR
jgi:hypothetical protein